MKISDTVQRVAAIYGLGVLLNIPGEFQVWYLIGRKLGEPLLPFQGLMMLSDGLGFVILFLAVGLVCRDRLWPEHGRMAPLLLSALGGAVIAIVTETVGPMAFPSIWVYPRETSPWGIFLGALIAWTALPPLFFRAYGRGWHARSVAPLAAALIALLFLGDRLISPYSLAR